MSKYDITVELTGGDGNAFNILGVVLQAVRRSGHPDRKKIMKEYTEEVTAGDYDHLLQTTMRWFDVE